MRSMARDTTPSRTRNRRSLGLEALEPRDVPSAGPVANQDGLAAQAITAAVAGGATYFSSAGNQGESGYDTPFRGATTTLHGITGRWHDFDAGPFVDPTQTVTLQPGQTTIVFQYDEPFYGGGVKRNADLYLFDGASGSVLASGTDDNTATGVPREIVTYFNPSSTP